MNNNNNNADYENILNMIRLNSIELSKYYKKKYYELKSTYKYFKIPIIILSSINSVLSVSLNSFVEQKYVSIITCLISLICGVIGSIELFLQIQTHMEKAHTNSKDFYILSIDIYKMLNLKSEHRNIDEKVFLEEVYTAYCKIIENSQLVDKKIIDSLTEILDLKKHISNNLSSSNSLNSLSDLNELSPDKVNNNIEEKK